MLGDRGARGPWGRIWKSFIVQVPSRPYATGMAGREHDARNTLLCSQDITDWAQPSAFSLTTAPKSCSPSASPERLRLTPQEAATPHPWYHVCGTTVRMWSQDDTHLDSRVPSCAWHREPATILKVGNFWKKQLTPQKKIFSSQANIQSSALTTPHLLIVGWADTIAYLVELHKIVRIIFYDEEIIFSCELQHVK